MPFARFLPVAAVAGLVVGLVPSTGLAATADARAPKPVITSVEAAYGSSVGYTHLIIHGRHLTGGKVTIAGRRTYAKVINSKVISAFPAGHHHGKRFTVVVRTKAGKSNAKRYEFRHASQPGSLHATAVPAGSGVEQTYTITRCPAAGTCISIGSDDAGRVLARVMTRGRTTTQRIPAPAASNGSMYLADLSCPAVTFCAAIGGYNADTAGVLSTWNGSTWTTRRTPNPVGDDPYPDRQLSKISCGAPAHCVAIDEENVYTLDDSTLRVVARVAPVGLKDVRVARVSCPAAGWCSVLGSGDDATADHNFVAVRRGTVWSTRTLPNPAGTTRKFGLDLDGFDCAHIDRCTILAGGLAGGGAAPLYFAVLHAGAVRWTKVRLPADAKKSTRWDAEEYTDASLHCPSTGTCWALSAYSVHGLKGKRGYQPVALRLHDGTKVRVFPLPRPASSKTGHVDVNDLSCATPGSCVAVGSRGNADVDNHTHGDAIVETYAHGVWTPAAAPSPAGRPKYSGYEFTSIDCGGVGSCTAVGDYSYDHTEVDDEPSAKTRTVVLDIVRR